MTLRKYAVGLLAALALSTPAPAGFPYPEPLLAQFTAPLNPVRGNDNYLFESAPFTKLDINVKVVYYQSFEELAVAHGDIKRAGTLMAFAIPNNGKGQCEIHMMDPKKVYYPQYVGHELLHCIHGNFHPNQ